MKHDNIDKFNIDQEYLKTEVETPLDKLDLREKNIPKEVRQILDSVDAIISTHLRFVPKENEGMQALIFKLNIEADVKAFPEKERKLIENYLGEAKSLKILKITNSELAKTEFEWQYKAFSIYEAVPEVEKKNYARIPKPFLCHDLVIDEQTRQRLNRQNAYIAEEKASVMVMEWVEGEDLLTKIFRKFLERLPAYKDIANNLLVGFQSLLIAISGAFKSRGIDFNDLPVLEQYQRLFKTLSDDNTQILTDQQKLQIKNTLELLHKNGIYHNDLHLRNFLVGSEENAQISIIDFGKATNREFGLENNINYMFVLNLTNQFRTINQLESHKLDSIKRDVDRFMKLDRGYPILFEQIKKFDLTQIISVLDRESTQWKLDVWNVKRAAAVARAMESVDESKAHIIQEYLKDKSENLSQDSRDVIDWLVVNSKRTGKIIT